MNLAEYFSPFDADPLFSTRATYTSDGLLRGRSTTSRAGATTARDLPTTDDNASIFYFAGRPLALLESEVTDPGGGGTPVSRRGLLYVTTDHIGTPAMACEETGAMRWSGGFEPFGGDFTGAQEAGVFLRFLGQWQDDAWQQAAGSGPLYYNVHRWYQADNGWYLELDPFERDSSVSLYVYAQANPIVIIDPLGLFGLADIPAAPAWVGNFSAGFGDVLLFGFGDDLRGALSPDAAALIDQCSGSYKWGEGAGIAASFATGFAGGAKAAGTAGTGKVLSHWIPFRNINPASRSYKPWLDNRFARWLIHRNTRPGPFVPRRGHNLLNGNYVTRARHYLHDPKATLKGRVAADKWSPWIRQLDRIPRLPLGSLTGLLYGNIGAALSGPECEEACP